MTIEEHQDRVRRALKSLNRTLDRARKDGVRAQVEEYKDGIWGDVAGFRVRMWRMDEPPKDTA